MTPGQSPDPFSPASAAPSAALGGSSGNTAPFGGSLDRMQELSMQAGATPNSGGKGGSGVRKVNNLPVYLVGVIIAMFIGIMVYVATQRADASRAEDEALKGSTQSSMDVANALSGNAPEGYAPASAPVSVATGLDRPPAPDGLDADAERIRQIKQRMFEEAVKAKLVVPGGAPRSAGRMPPGAGAQQGVQQTALNGGDSLGNTNPVQALLDQQGRMTNMLEQTASRVVSDLGRAGQGGGGGAGGPMTAAAGGVGRNNLQQFDSAMPGTDRWSLNNPMDIPKTPYVLRTGFVIPALLITGINSDLPGQIIAQVSQNVYDTPTGKHILLPQGTRLVGAYVADIAFGQERVMVAWQRMIYPDGKALDIGSMPGADQAGFSGLADQVDHHLLRAFGSAILLSGVSAAIASTQKETASLTASGAPTYNSAVSQALGQQMGQLALRLLEKNLNISPTIRVRPGFRLNVVVTKDMTFTKPYQAFDY